MIEALKPIIQKVSEFQLEQYRTEGLTFDTKSGPCDFVSEVDIKSQEFIVEEIEKEFPGAGIIGEEGVQERVLDSEFVFVIDPLDGTSNYRSKLDNWAVSVGLLQNGRIFEGILAFPLHNSIVCSPEMKPDHEVAFSSAEDLFLFGTDRVFEQQTLPFKNVKKRLFGATVPTVYYCFKKAFQGRPGLDFALLGTPKLWDIAGAAACLKQLGGSLLDLEGTDLLRANLIAKYSKKDLSISKSFPVIASLCPAIADLVLEAMQAQQKKAVNF
jgi:fructose-1,6-bisphosphatase/inositol monophosphatase family enzyme